MKNKPRIESYGKIYLACDPKERDSVLREVVKAGNRLARDMEQAAMEYYSENKPYNVRDMGTDGWHKIEL